MLRSKANALAFQLAYPLFNFEGLSVLQDYDWFQGKYLNSTNFSSWS